ncbi:Cytochrome P450 E-class group I [Penicillium samsonianum]|uniref:Cytochrome P450 E-class group I n=1 Tax=Penicillium samsonianum TaxID=1882272 RepID=UPI0025466CA0|nr:Cytochrome P450 E-class group I [Penicillium samsonianum]KAJ6139569.1 Cytochrome P450 E-class group I [Penicillium samsonianum]
MTWILIAALIVAVLVYQLSIFTLFSPLARIPGPKTFALTKFKLAYEDYKGTRTRKINALHQQYGPVVRIGPSEVTFNSTSALRAIYGAGSGFERTGFYHMFEAYGRKNMFSFATAKQHGERKKLFAHAYAKSVMLKGQNAEIVEQKVKLYMDLLQRDGGKARYFLPCIISPWTQSPSFSTDLSAKLDVSRDWGKIARSSEISSTLRAASYREWLYSRTGVSGCIAKWLYPMQLPTTYSGIRLHAMKATQTYASASDSEKATTSALISRLWNHHHSQKTNGIDDLDIASECADHLLAGIDTTSDTLMFLIWALSRPENKEFQDKLIEEVCNIPDESLNSNGIPKVESSDKLSYLDAVIKETLRLYAPLPGSEPRSLPTTATIDGYTIPPRTVVSISPYALHRNAEVFKSPTKFNPDRWLDPSENLADMKKWFWAFSSGGRMCIGMHLAMAEMTTLVAAIYRKYRTTPMGDFGTVSPGITGRYEVFYDDTCSRMREHECQVEFTPH